MTTLLAILAYPGAQTAAILGLRDLLEGAVRLNTARGGRATTLVVRILEAGDPLIGLDPPLAALILPPALGADPAAPADPILTARLRQLHRGGTLLCSVCAGAFLLAETGLLAGRPATTHWALAARFGQCFPEVRLDADRLVIDDGDLITAGGLMAWVDLGLCLVDRFLGPEAMLATARHFLVEPGGREQRFYSTFSPALGHGDGAILRAQAWLQAHAGEPVDIAQMARAARLGERTFLRRFQGATSLRPTEYLQHLRVSKARDLLERSNLAMADLAMQVGYQDPGAFRKVFQRLMGLSPSEYRRRFQMARHR